LLLDAKARKAKEEERRKRNAHLPQSPLQLLNLNLRPLLLQQLHELFQLFQVDFDLLFLNPSSRALRGRGLETGRVDFVGGNEGAELSDEGSDAL
jgi:hypothetical protein